MNRETIDSVVRSLRRVNLQGSFFGQTVAIRFGLSESDVEALEVLLDTGAATAGRLSELMGLTTGAVTRVIDRLEQAGYVRRVPDPADRRRVIVELVPEKMIAVQATMDQFGEKSASEIGHVLRRRAGRHQRLPDADGGGHARRGERPARHARPARPARSPNTPPRSAAWTAPVSCSGRARTSS